MLYIKVGSQKNLIKTLVYKWDNKGNYIQIILNANKYWDTEMKKRAWKKL
jgi:hypothetical protein